MTVLRLCSVCKPADLPDPPHLIVEFKNVAHLRINEYSAPWVNDAFIWCNSPPIVLKDSFNSVRASIENVKLFGHLRIDVATC